jgi:hypothetical protein
VASSSLLDAFGTPEVAAALVAGVAMNSAALIAFFGVSLVLKEKVGEAVAKVFVEKKVLTEDSLPAALTKAGMLTQADLVATLKAVGYPLPEDR